MEHASKPTYRLSGVVRLGILLTGVWLIALPIAYVLGVYFNPPFLHEHFEWAYSWWESAPTPKDPLGLFPAYVPEARIRLAALLILGVPSLSWLLAYVLPKSLFWVVEGFRRE